MTQQRKIVQKERWHHYERYGIWVSDLGDVQNSLGASLTPHLVNGDLRISSYYGGGTRSFSLKRLVAEAFIPKPFVGNSGLIDFADGDMENCRASNLVWKRREQKERGAYKEPGVSFSKETNRWKVYAVIDRVVRHIGYFVEKSAAIAARDKGYAMIAAGSSMEEVRNNLREIVRDEDKPPRKPRTKPVAVATSVAPTKAKALKESWKDWDEAKKILRKVNRR